MIEGRQLIAVAITDGCCEFKFIKALFIVMVATINVVALFGTVKRYEKFSILFRRRLRETSLNKMRIDK